MSNKMLADWTKLSPKKVREITGQMKAAGEIEVDPDRKTAGGHPLYRIKKD